MPAPYRHVIWDWNGTLLDDLELCVSAMNAMLARRGLPLLDRARYHALFGFPVRAYYERLGLDVSGTQFEVLSAEFIAAYEAGRLGTRLQPHAESVLAAVEAAGLTQSILSAYHQTTLREIVAYFGLAQRFVRLTGLDNIHAHGKVELGRLWLKELGLPRAEVLLIGDTLHDLEVAQDLGVDCILVAHGHHSAERLRAAHTQVYANLRELGAMFAPSQPTPIAPRDLSRATSGRVAAATAFMRPRAAAAARSSGSGNPAGSESPPANR
jgi:phosphoglycolate phosphatase